MTAESPSAAEEERLAARIVASMMEKDAFSRWLGITIQEVRPRAVSVRMRVRPDMLNGFGVCHGGVTFALADSALAFVSNTNGRVTMSIDNSISYPVSVREGDILTAEAVEESESRRIAFYRVVVRREDTVVALFRGTVYRTDRLHDVNG